MSHVFISYHKASSQTYARKLARYITERGFDIWIDDQINFSSNWERTIFKAIDDSAAFIVIMTPDAYKSDWVQAERLYAKKQNKPVFPLLLEGDIFPAYLGSQIPDVQDGEMPPDSFIQQIGLIAPFSAIKGRNVAEYAEESVIAPLPRQKERLIAALLILGLIAAVLVLLFASATGLFSMQTPTVEPSAQFAQVGASANTLSAPATPKLQTQVWIDLTTTADFGATSQTTHQYLEAQHAAIATLTATYWTPTFTPSALPTFTPTATDTPLIVPTPTVFGGGRIPQIAFMSDMDSNWDIYVINADGTNMRLLTGESTLDDLDPTWSPDGSQIAYAALDQANYDLYIMNADGSSAQRLTYTEGIREYHVDWSPDGTRLLYTSESEIDVTADLCILTIATLEENCLFSAADQWEGYGGWSPDGTQITYTAFDGTQWGVYIANADGTHAEALTLGTNRVYDAAWSPDGDLLAYSEDDGTQFDIFIIDLNTGVSRRMTETRASDYHPSWSADGELLSFDSDQTGDFELYLMRVSSGIVIDQITHDSVREVYPAWHP